ncbi:Lrp/AsnC family transcriptional regulator [Paenarthrobacter sp. DKR-5]|uniref:Lrp/AsnC family transcriptional regulator n=1 Tax=Paenarthrobacter sp. DKR-5 TaxID=2835535 RepID=UPI001BDD6739|nr:Lrp/AsnC family transcriptional regulator [Paenarthrobacter sp. DKR-5]MBT1003173.1 Lrp/AsnC family transcriptional regulator [Paenarthrobacter sp. DKR-5]
MGVDALDARIVTFFTEHPRASVLEASRLLGAARGTVQARLDRLAREGVIASWAPQVDPGTFGFPVVAFVSLAINQDLGHHAVSDGLAGIPEILELHTVTGESDLLARVVARSNADLQRVLDAVLATRTVVRASTVIVLNTHFQGRTLPLFRSAAGLQERPGVTSGHS